MWFREVELVLDIVFESDIFVVILSFWYVWFTDIGAILQGAHRAEDMKFCTRRLGGNRR